jgi:peptide/nickel transport system substrate-binding protein
VKSQITLDKDELTKIEQQIDEQTFKDGYGLPLFQLPGVFGATSRVDGIKYNGGQSGPFWNFWEWSVKSSTAK